MAQPKIDLVKDQFLDKLYDYPGLENYMGNFQVNLKYPELCSDMLRRSHLKDYIVVFKRKALSPKELRQRSNIYSYDRSNIDLDALDATKALSSCIRCRKFKKKCTRDLPECLNCGSCDELCIYSARKRKGSVAENKRRSLPLGSRKSSVGAETFEPSRRFSMPEKFDRNYCHYNSRGGSDLHRLLN